MTSDELRERYIKFFVERGHVQIPSAPLVLENDPSTLFTSSGMQPLVPYLKGEQEHPAGRRLTNSQPCFRAEDIEEVGDNRHTTFFEMLGNWSLGDYFKKEQLTWFWEFLTKELNLPKEKLYVSVFEGTDQVSRDNETCEIWESLAVSKDHIYFYGAEKNWWSRSGPPENMVPGDIGGPDSEVFYDLGAELGLHENSHWKGKDCHPNCECGRFVEIGNSVFISYKKKEDGSLEELPQKNVDFGGGLERLVAVVNNQPDVFKTDLLWPIVEAICAELSIDTEIEYGKDQTTDQVIRVIADHMRAAVFLVRDGVTPSNKIQGYLLRRLIRRSAVKFTSLGGMLGMLNKMTAPVLNAYDNTDYLQKSEGKVQKVIYDELERFRITLDQGLEEFNKRKHIDGKIAFDLYQTYGFPLELTEELARDRGLKINRREFSKEFEKHKELSRTASAGMFRGGLASTGEAETKYHTVTHLLHQALREVLGNHVIQKGSNITFERLRFDFSHSEKLAKEEIRKVEDLVNEQIEKGLSVSCEEMDKEEALKGGAIGAFGERYGDRVKVYTIGEPPFSREVCGGPHVLNTSEIGRVTIRKEGSAGAGVRRIYAIIDG
ncbi:MAG: alanine--tRNA ligase [Candidatus Blackburnbacteria bacterium]|nr:alanine--tRNA ligase [Candidatus Blackburnbacteria bacterium]